MGAEPPHWKDWSPGATGPAADTSDQSTTDLGGTDLGTTGVQDPRILTALFWSAWVLALIAAATAFAIWAARSREAALDAARGDVARVAGQGTAYVESIVGLADEVLARLSANTSEADLNNLALDRLCPSLICADYGRSARALLIAFARANGEVVIVGSSAPPASLAGRDYFATLQASDVGLSVGKPRRNRIVEGTYLPMARRLAPVDGAFHGIVAGAINVDLIRVFFQGLGVNAVDRIALRDAGGEILVGWPGGFDAIDHGRGCGPSGPGDEDLASSGRLRLGGLSVDACRATGNALRAWRERTSLAAGGALALLLAPALAFPVLRRRWERRLRQQRGLRGLVAGSSDAQFIVAAKPNGTFVLEALSFTQGGQWGRMSARLVGRTTGELFPTDEADLVDADYRSVLASGESRRIERRITLAGTRFVWSTLLVPLRDSGGGYIFGAASDLGGELPSEDGLRGFTESVLRREDSERRRIAREIHDTTGQNLIAAGFELAAVARGLGDAPPHVHAALGEARNLVDASVAELRTLSYVLYPPFLDEAGLGLALTTLAVGFGKRTGLNVAVSVAADLEGHRWAPEVELALYRVAQEALTNVQRHAPEKEALVVLASDVAGWLGMEVTNGNGATADGEALAPFVTEGAGIRGMRDRLEALGGSLAVVRTADGFRVAATIPAEPVPGAGAA